MNRRDFIAANALGLAAQGISRGQTQPPKPRTYWRDPLSLRTASHWRKHAMHGKNSKVPSPPVTPYIDPLPVPAVLRPVNGALQVGMSEFTQKLHHDLPPTRLWGYNGTYPGPTLEVRSGSPASVQFQNNLPLQHFLPVDNSIHGAENTVPAVRAVVHLHGIKVLPEYDGYPEAWSTSDGHTGPFFHPGPHIYPNDQPATTLWYHDHALGITRLNVYTGLAGIYLIRDAAEDALNLPKGDYEIPLLIQDRLFNTDGSLQYPVAVGGTHPLWIPEFFGDTVLVNGKVWPYLEVEPRKYRFRLVNGSNARFYHLILRETDASGTRNGGRQLTMHQIGTDGGLLPAPVDIKDFLMAPAERFDLVVDFSGFDGRTFIFENDAPAPYPGGGEVTPSNVMMFRVTRQLSGKDTSTVPSKLATIPVLQPTANMVNRYLAVTELDRDSDGFPIIGMLDNKMWDDPVTENPKVGDTEIWNLVNATGDAHPKHVHLVQFQILDRRPFDADTYLSTNQINYTGKAVAPDANEVHALKDTVKTYPGTVTRIIAKFDLPTGTVVTPGTKYRYVWHCHILEHEDNEMMRPYDVVA